MKEYLSWYYAPAGPGVEFEYLAGSSYVLEECGDCGLIYQREIPGPALMKRLYEHWIDPEIDHRSQCTGRGTTYGLYAASEIARGLDIVGKLPLSEVKFLDFGMGWGHWCLLAKGFGCDVYGLELSDTRSTHATQLGITVLRRSDLATNRLDFINAEQVLEHIPDPFATLTELAAVLNPGGVI